VGHWVQLTAPQKAIPFGQTGGKRKPRVKMGGKGGALHGADRLVRIFRVRMYEALSFFQQRGSARKARKMEPRNPKGRTNRGQAQLYCGGKRQEKKRFGVERGEGMFCFPKEADESILQYGGKNGIGLAGKEKGVRVCLKNRVGEKGTLEGAT